MSVRAVLALVLGLFLAYGTGGGNAVAADLIQEIQARGTFRVAMAPAPPWQSQDPMTGEYEGFNVDVAERVAKVLNVKLEIVPQTWGTIIPGLLSKQYDVVFANLFATPERAVVVNFTEPYATYGFNIIVPASSGFESLDELNSPDVTFVGMTGTVEESYPKEIFPEAKVRGIVTENVATWVGEVASGRAEASFLDPYMMGILTQQSPNLKERIRVLNDPDKPLKPVGLSYAVRPDVDSAHMLEFLNTFIKDLVRTGESEKLVAKWVEKLANAR